MKRLSISRQELLERYASGEKDFSGVKISGLEDRVSKGDWNGVDLCGVVFRNAHLVHIDLNGANLREADFTGAKIGYVNIAMPYPQVLKHLSEERFRPRKIAILSQVFPLMSDKLGSPKARAPIVSFRVSQEENFNEKKNLCSIPRMTSIQAF